MELRDSRHIMNSETGYSKNATAYALAGQPDAPAVALIHGLGINRHMWDQHIPFLSERYRVLTYDLCGHGESAPPLSAPSLVSFSEQLHQLLQELGIMRCALVGFSLGGMINRRFAMDYASRVSALGVLNSPHERDPVAQKLVEERAAETSVGGPGATLEATIERWFTDAFRRERPDAIAQIREWVLANEGQNYAACRRVLAHGVVELIRPEPPIVAPALVMTCEYDSGSTPSMSYAIGSEIAGARVIIVPRLRHMGLMEEPELFARHVLQFLDDVLDQSKQYYKRTGICRP